MSSRIYGSETLKFGYSYFTWHLCSNDWSSIQSIQEVIINAYMWVICIHMYTGIYVHVCIYMGIMTYSISIVSQKVPCTKGNYSYCADKKR